MVSPAGSDVPGQSGPRGLGVAVPLLQKFPPVGVIGNRFRSRPGLHSDGDLHTESVGPAPRGLSAGKVFPNTPMGWGTQEGQSPEKHPVCPPPMPSTYIEDLTRPSCQHSEASVVPPHPPDLNINGQKSQGGASQVPWRELEELENQGFQGSWPFVGIQMVWGA